MQEITEEHIYSLLEKVIQKAKDQLEMNGQLLPFGTVLDKKLEIHSLDAHWGTGPGEVALIKEKLEIAAAACLESKSTGWYY